MESIIKEDEGTFSAIFHSTLESIIVVDEKGFIILANPQSEKMFSYEENGLIGKNVDILIPKERRTHHKTQRNAYVSDTSPAPRQMGKGRDLVGLGKNGDRFPIEISLTD